MPQTHGHGDSMTNSAQWGRVGENQKLPRCVTARHIKQDRQKQSHKRKHTTFQVKWLEWDCVKKKIMVYPEYTITLYNFLNNVQCVVFKGQRQSQTCLIQNMEIGRFSKISQTILVLPFKDKLRCLGLYFHKCFDSIVAGH